MASLFCLSRNFPLKAHHMKKLIATLVLLFNCAAVGFSQTQARWIKYDSTEGRYNVSLPSQPTLKTQEATSASGEKLMQYMASATDADSAYVIGYFDYLPGTTFSFDKARDGMIANVKGTLLKQSSISLGGYPGIEFEVSADANGTEYLIWARGYDIDKRVYILQFLFSKSLDQDPAVRARGNKYFDSFHVVRSKP